MRGSVSVVLQFVIKNNKVYRRHLGYNTAASGGCVVKLDCNSRKCRLCWHNATRHRIFKVNNNKYYPGIITGYDFYDFSVGDISTGLAGFSVMAREDTGGRDCSSAGQTRGQCGPHQLLCRTRFARDLPGPNTGPLTHLILI